SQNSRSIKEILFDNIAEEASRDAVSSLNPQKLELGSYDTIFQSDAAGDIIGSFIQLGFSVRRWEDYVEVGSVCGPEILTVKDDPLNRETLIPLPFDSEGTPTKPLTLVDRGVVKNKCFDKKLALQKNTVSTGHSPFTHDITYSSKFFVGWPYYPTNQFVSPGSGDSQSLIENERRAVLVKRLMYAGLPMGVHATEQHRDVMEAYTMGTWLVKDGEVEHSLHSLRISESLSKMIKSVKEVGGVNTIKRLGCLNTPWIVVSNVTYTEEADLSFRV
ncbi:MAG: metallopeptidase TldD-related protein, partial [Candidatus Bathyarchaeia archaeon]